MRQAKDDLYTAAQWYAEHGIPVFPLWPLSKKPLTEHGFLNASIDPAQVTEWWTQHPQANIAMPTGTISRRTLMDCDFRGQCRARSRDDVIELYGGWDDTAEVKTGTGSLHVYFDGPLGRLPKQIDDGIELKSDGGYGVLPPSIHPNGNPYAFDGLRGRETFLRLKPDGDRDIWTLPLDISDPERPKPGKPVPFLQTPAVEAWLVFSPDSRYVAYISNESGRYEIYVRQAPGRDGKPAPGKWQVSTGGGMYPEWSPNGRELFYLDFNNHRIMVTDYSASRGSFSSGKPRVWSDRQIRRVGNYRNFAVAADGKHVAVFPMPEGTAPGQGRGARNVPAEFL